ncbi:MAG: leucyl/phenylalanyl-tRNA--protein transferase [Pseudarcicella sp.]|nr:leucyl/phenylalanyl-tRNA--protein transferase [Pseudarcicella sp.]MBP6411330.1 leucyl/phenylalanyl-tRNA--protein transferase [Pseudarcicella sp.]
MSATTLQALHLLGGYRQGIFPMADPEENNQIYWHYPEERAIIPLENYKPSKSLRPIINQNKFEIRYNFDFEATIRACAMPRANEPNTWISEEMIAAYVDLNKMGYAFSVETYLEGKLVGGLYGVAIGSVFFGESMFHTVSNSSKVAFHFLIENLKKRGYRLLDSQLINDNVIRYGAIEIPRDEFLEKLKPLLDIPCSFLG